MILGTGIDVTQIERLVKAIARFGEPFLQRIFTPKEIQHCESRANRIHGYAARFAAKEAAMKALGTGWSQGVQWCDIELQFDAAGNATMILRGRAATVAAELGTKRVIVSVARSHGYALALVVLEK